MLVLNLNSQAGKQYQQLLYNGLDCCGTLEIAQKLSSLPVAPEVSQVEALNHQLLVPALTMMQRGIRVNLEERETRLRESLETMESIQPLADTLVSKLKRAEQVSVGSPAQVLSFLNSLGAGISNTQETTTH